MLCKIQCSFGEVIDKLTILEIKMNKVVCLEQQKNISKEYNLLKKYKIENDEYFTKVYNELSTVNMKLWNMEDTIRQLSSLKIYNQTFIQIAQGIHEMNDFRAHLKKQLNIRYKSDLCEEKIYNIPQNIRKNSSPNDDQMKDIEDINILLINLEYEKVKSKIDELMIVFDRKDELPSPSEFLGKLYFMYLIIYEIFKLDIPSDILQKIKYIADNTRLFFQSQNDIQLCTKVFGKYLLSMKDYPNAKKYIIYLEPSTCPSLNILCENMSYFSENDIDKTLLVYASGGLGDMIMYSRFIPKLSLLNPKNKIDLIIHNGLYWMLENSKEFSQLKNVRLILSSSRQNEVAHFDHHTNLNLIHHHMSLSYEDIFELNYLQSIDIELRGDLRNLISKTKKNICFHWKGSQTIGGESRDIELSHFETLFQLNQNNNWISLQKGVSSHEKQILNKYNIQDLSHFIDLGDELFYDTIGLMRQCQLFITNDTSLVHVCGTDASCPCIVLLPTNNDWRWTYNDSKSNWYQNLKLYRQKSPNDWETVFQNLINEIQT
tara:strand:+ start:1447 stop:3081 length:1635 start_codon:yes stop_codon:yes gene_type:complete